MQDDDAERNERAEFEGSRSKPRGRSPPEGPFAYSFERLRAYQAAERALAAFVRAKEQLKGEIADQLHRALVSVCLNLAEGAGRRTALDRRRHYSIALGSAAEAMAALRLARIVSLPQDALREVEARLRELGPMVLAMVNRG